MTTVASAHEAPAAGRHTAPGAIAPLIRDCWYVLASRDEFDRTPKQRWILGEPVCFFAATDGSLVVLDDRCAHRRFPLSRSRLEGDEIVCGYHGFAYGVDGRCVRVPGGADPGPVRVRSYPAVARGPWVWIWAGANPDDADADQIPWPAEASADGDITTGYAEIPANYSLVHENLLDLTHLEFLHGIGSSGYVASRPTMLSAAELPAGFEGTAVGYRHRVEEELGVFAIAAGEEPTTRVIRSEYQVSATPAINYGVLDVRAADPASPIRLSRFVVVHCLTPADDAHTHQFWTYWQDVPMAIERTDWANSIAFVFQQDIEALGWVQTYVGRDHRPGVVERSAAFDAPGLRMRRKLRELASGQPSTS